jgi:serine/threonine-protein kinase
MKGPPTDSDPLIDVLHAMHGDQVQAVAALKREATYLAMLRSPCFARILRTGVTPAGLPYFVMEYVPGKALDAVLRETGPMPADRVLAIMDQVCEGVAELHSRDILHRDLKCGNLILEEWAGGGTRVRLLDLGSAKPAYEKEAGNPAVRALSIGSPPYLAPETAAQGTTSELTDLYSLGAVAYEMLCGIRAIHIKDTSPDAYIAYLKSEEPIPTYRVGTLQPEIPETIEGIVHRALSRDPRARFSTAGEMRKALADAALALAGQPAGGTRTAAPPRAGGTTTPHTPFPPPDKGSDSAMDKLARLIPLRFRKQ